MHLKILNAIDTVSIIEKNNMANFVVANTPDVSHDLVLRSIEYALNDYITQGGFVIEILTREFGDILGVAIVNKTGISGYFPENLLVYLVAKEGEQYETIENTLFDEVLKYSKGDVLLNNNLKSCSKTASKKGFEKEFVSLTYAR